LVKCIAGHEATRDSQHRTQGAAQVAHEPNGRHLDLRNGRRAQQENRKRHSLHCGLPIEIVGGPICGGGAGGAVGVESDDPASPAATPTAAPAPTKATIVIHFLRDGAP
jgi:hypothetical protein